MDVALLATGVVVALLFIAVSTYFFFFRSRQSSGPVIYLVGPSGSGKTALWSYVASLRESVS
jgi:ABC-type cobalamin transport system ATPase subunit